MYANQYILHNLKAHYNNRLCARISGNEDTVQLVAFIAVRIRIFFEEGVVI